MNNQELGGIINNFRDVAADGARIEFKAAEQDFPKTLWEILSSYANTPGGGLIVLGVSETASGFVATGVKRPEKYEKDAASLCD